MDKAEYQRLIDATESHWWFEATSRLIETVLFSNDFELPPRALCLDAGGGTGATSSWLARRHPTVLCEIESMALDAAIARYPYLAARGDLNRLPFPDAAFDAVLCVTALCHEMNTDPAATVRELSRVVAPGGRLLLLEPHHPWLWRGHDRITHTARRFTLRQLRTHVVDAGLRIERATAGFSFLVPPAGVVKLLDRNGSTSDVGRNQTGVFGLAGALARLERRWLRHHDLAVGLSAIVVGSK